MKNLNLYKGFENLVKKMKKNGVNVEKSTLQKRLLAIGLAPILLTSGIAVGCDNNEPVEIVEEEEQEQEEKEQEQEDQLSEDQLSEEELEMKEVYEQWSMTFEGAWTPEMVDYFYDVEKYLTFDDFYNEAEDEHVVVSELKENYGDDWIMYYATSIPRIDMIKLMLVNRFISFINHQATNHIPRGEHYGGRGHLQRANIKIERFGPIAEDLFGDPRGFSNEEGKKTQELRNRFTHAGFKNMPADFMYFRPYIFSPDLWKETIQAPQQLEMDEVEDIPLQYHVLLRLAGHKAYYDILEEHDIEYINLYEETAKFRNLLRSVDLHEYVRENGKTKN